MFKSHIPEFFPRSNFSIHFPAQMMYLLAQAQTLLLHSIAFHLPSPHIPSVSRLHSFALAHTYIVIHLEDDVEFCVQRCLFIEVIVSIPLVLEQEKEDATLMVMHHSAAADSSTSPTQIAPSAQIHCAASRTWHPCELCRRRHARASSPSFLGRISPARRLDLPSPCECVEQGRIRTARSTDHASIPSMPIAAI